MTTPYHIATTLKDALVNHVGYIDVDGNHVDFGVTLDPRFSGDYAWLTISTDESEHFLVEVSRTSKPEKEIT